MEGKPRPVCPACGRVHYINPVPVAACIIELDGRIVLVRRRYEPGRGGWAFPAGYVDADETVQDAARREAREETGLDVELGPVVDVRSFFDADRSGIVIFFRARARGGEPSPGDDAEAVKLVGPTELSADMLVFESHRQAWASWLGSRPECAAKGDRREGRNHRRRHRAAAGADC